MRGDLEQRPVNVTGGVIEPRTCRPVERRRARAGRLVDVDLELGRGQRDARDAGERRAGRASRRSPSTAARPSSRSARGSRR